MGKYGYVKNMKEVNVEFRNTQEWWVVEFALEYSSGQRKEGNGMNKEILSKRKT